jgi:hypothetical protein
VKALPACFPTTVASVHVTSLREGIIAVPLLHLLFLSPELFLAACAYVCLKLLFTMVCPTDMLSVDAVV